MIRRNRRSKSEGKIAHKKTTIDGITFDSKMESQYYTYLKEEKKKGNIISFELQPEYILQPKYFVFNSQVITEDNKDYKSLDQKRRKYNKLNPNNKIDIVRAIKYKSDFYITYKDGTSKVIDVKGIKTADFKIKEKMFNFRYPHLPFECVIWDNPTKQWLEYSQYEILKKQRKKKKK